jgi:kynurenine formamidase
VSGSRLIDVSHVVEQGMITYKGLPAPVICDFLSRETSRKHYDPGTEFQIGKIEMVANTGTYVDSPFGDGGRAVGPDAFQALDVRGKAVLVETGWADHWRTDRYFEGHPYLTADAAMLLAERGASLVGIDSFNIDDTEDGSRPAHTILLGAEIPIVEHMRGLDALPGADFRFFAVPVKVKAFGSFPVRAFGLAP